MDATAAVHIQENVYRSNLCESPRLLSLKKQMLTGLQGPYAPPLTLKLNDKELRTDS
jgi:hypothetical protein